MIFATSNTLLNGDYYILNQFGKDYRKWSYASLL